MAKIEMGILGGFSGRVGTVVGYHRHGQWYIRAYRPHINDRKSAAQLRQRSRFRAMIQFASPATPVLRVGLLQQADAQGLTEGNVFLKINKECFSGESGNPGKSGNAGNPGINYPALRFSLGRLAAPKALQYTVDERNVLTAKWSAEGGRLADRVHLYLYCPATGRGLCLAADRGQRHLRLLLPQEFALQDLHLWAFAASADGEVSPTVYGFNNEGTTAPPAPTAYAAPPAGQPLSPPAERSGSRRADRHLSPPGLPDAATAEAD